MEFGSYQLQIFVSLTVILMAAFVALICDYLKRNNEQLRELVIELRVRREEEQKRSVKMSPRSIEQDEEALAAPATSTLTANQTSATPDVFPFPDVVGQTHHTSAQAEPIIRVTVPAEPLALEAGAEPLRMNTGRDREAMLERAAPRPVAAETLVAAIPSGSFVSFRTDEEHQPEEIVNTENLNSSAPAPANQTFSTRGLGQPVPVVVTLSQHFPSEVGDSREFSASEMSPSNSAFKAPPLKDWGSLLSRARPQRQDSVDIQPVEVREDLIEAVVAATSAQRAESSLSQVPAGFHDGFVLTRLLKSRKPVSGLVVSIGVSAGVLTGPDGPSSVPDSIRGLIQTLMGPRDFACQVGTEEFLLIYPNENGAAAQRRLNLISQSLWDFQLGSLGGASILFSWGGVEVRSELIEEAFASASERMRETKRARKDFSIDRTLQQAV